MTIITFPLADTRPEHPHLRRFDVRRDLAAVADLVERCFAETLDRDGRQYIRNMRRAAQQPHLLGLFGAGAERAAYPFAGFVWEQDGAIVGNLSLIPMFFRRQRIYLIANVAVDPAARRRGIARSLTEAAVKDCIARRADGIWLHVREDNPAAIQLYTRLNFVEQARRTSWHSRPELPEPASFAGVSIEPPAVRNWHRHLAWLASCHPEDLDWYLALNVRVLHPGLSGAVVRLLSGASVRQWAALRAGSLEAVLSWQKTSASTDRLWLACPPDPDEEAVQMLLHHARTRIAGRKTLNLELPAGQATGPLERSGFNQHQTLIWMRYKNNPSAAG